MHGGNISWDGNVPQMPAQKVQGIEAIPLTPAERKTMPRAASADTVSGFGADLPLLVALQQVVPQQYKVSLSPGVDPGVHVSWQGERPWEQVLSDMLSPVQLSFAIQGNMLVVKHLGSNKLPGSRAIASARRVDMIPADMISGNAYGKFMPPPQQQMQPALPEQQVQQMQAEPMQHLQPAPLLPMSPPVGAPVRMAAVPMPVSPSVPSVMQPSWHAERGQTLKAVLEDWSTAAHVRLYWSTDYDYKLNTDIAYGGNFEEAVSRLLDQFSAVKPQPYGELHNNPETGGVLVVNTYGTYN
jgi:hypothetical protein